MLSPNPGEPLSSFGVLIIIKIHKSFAFILCSHESEFVFRSLHAFHLSLVNMIHFSQLCLLSLRRRHFKVPGGDTML